MDNKYENNAKLFKALGDPNRLMILEMLQSGEECACNLLTVLDIGQSTLSHHMKILCEAGIVSCRRDAKWAYYCLDSNGREKTEKLLAEILRVHDHLPKNQDCTCD